ncbi:hypothetical protein D8X55_05010 [Malacoplasma penetrans]|uniref:P35 lipoprotein homolog n=1 Tax=Malacoplasma penetrans (strain HF-2) TaxID=272633 RepID=Q8EVA8_MALP2|nr:P35 family lipoprotein [Malacoplasma penetrans]RXY95980.1 hypothetical protein D8X55_05010 [Malacoplasma penetrans]BAC44449.1 P35 lipoprotein homolog [Malacoplasma penetrans HF-2]
MKIKKIKLLKALALTGAFGIVATVPVIVSSCSSTDNGGSGNNTGGNGNQGDGGGSGGTGQQENKTVKPELLKDVSLGGSLSTIYSSGSDSKTTNELISEDVKTNPEKYFTNGTELKDVIKQTKVTVDGGFSASEWQNGDPYSTWSTSNGIVKVTYPAAAPQIDIASLNDLKQKTFKDDAAIQTFLTAANLTFTGVTNYTVENQLSLSSGDLLHVNLKGTKSGGNLNVDLQIPVSNINLKATLKISVDATNNESGTNIEAVTDLTTNFSYNIGIDSTVNFTQTGATPTATEAEAKDAQKVLEKLGYVSSGALDNDKISAALGVYNCKFVAKSSEPGEGGKYNVTLTATPFDSNYIWDDGTSGPKDLQFPVSLTVS